MRAGPANRALLAAIMSGVALAPVPGSLVEVMPAPSRRDPPKPRSTRGPGEQFSRKARKRERAKERLRIKAGISGAKLWKKAKSGGL
jgi:hypothetical protein